MQRFVCRTLALLALALLTVTPVMAGDLEEPVPVPPSPELPSLEAQLEELPAQTPVPAPENLEQATDPALDSLLSIRPCEGDENDQCFPGCACVVVAGHVNCYC